MSTSTAPVSSDLTTSAHPVSAVKRAATRLFATDTAWSGPLLRLTLAAVMFPHGAQKALGWFGGYGFAGTMDFFTKSVGLPSPVAALVIALEFLGPVALLLGVGVRAVAAGFVGLMLGAIVTTHAANGFFMNWFGNQKGEGFEYHLLAIGIALALVVRGGGAWSVDRGIAARVGGR